MLLRPRTTPDRQNLEHDGGRKTPIRHRQHRHVNEVAPLS